MNKIFKKRIKRKRIKERRIKCHGNVFKCNRAHPFKVPRNIFDLIKKDVESKQKKQGFWSRFKNWFKNLWKS